MMMFFFWFGVFLICVFVNEFIKYSYEYNFNIELNRLVVYIV